MNRIVSATAAILAMASFSVAQAASIVAQLGAVNGKVLVNQGTGYIPADGALALNAGDQLMVGNKASAVVKFNSGCTVNIAAGQVFTVGTKAPCKAGEKVAMIGEDVVAPAADFDPGTGAAPFGLGGAALPLLLVGGTVVTVGAVLLLTKKSASP